MSPTSRSSAAGTGIAVLLWIALAAAPPAAAQAELFAGRTYPTGYDPQSIVATRLDADALDDLVIANAAANSLTFLMAQGGGEFDVETPLTVGAGLLQVLAADMNGDSRDDLVTLHRSTAKLELRLNDGSGGVLAPFVIAVGGTQPQQVAAGDFDEDGALDLVTANDLSDTVSLLRGNGSGALAPAVTFPVGNIVPEWTAHPKSLAVADFDEDGHLDVITANWDWPSTLSLLLGHGDGGFDAAENFPMGDFGIWGGQRVLTVDLNEDGHVDVCTSIAGSTGVVRLGDGAGGFQPDLPGFSYGPAAFGDFDQDGHLDGIVPGSLVRVAFGNGLGGVSSSEVYCAGSGGAHVAVIDVDQDGDLDVAVTNDKAEDVGLLVNDGTGVFAKPPLSPVGTGSSLAGVQLADLDDDGFLDAVTMNYTTPAIRLLAGDGTGAFLPSGSIPLSGTVHQTLVTDFDADGRDDIALLTSTGSEQEPFFVHVSLGNGAGGFAAPASLSVTGRPTSAAAGDMDGDGVLDLVLANTEPKGVTVRLGDGAGGFGPSLTTPIFGTFHVDRLALAHMDGDGLLDVVVSLPGLSWWGTRVLYGDGQGGFGSHLDVGLIAGELVPADLDADGDTDLVGMSGSFVCWTLNTGSGFGPGTTFIGGPGVPLVSDVDGDGDRDIVLTGGEDGTVTCLQNDGSGAFPTSASFLAGGRASSGAVGDLDGDGFADLVAGCDNFGVSLPDALTVLLNLSASPWQGLGHALHGSQGAPTLVGTGTLQPNSPVKLSIDIARPFGSAVLVIGSPAVNANFKGGVFVPFPSLLIFGLPLNAAGHFAGSGTWYSGLPSGASIYFQAWIADPAGPVGFAATNGLRGTTP